MVFSVVAVVVRMVTVIGSFSMATTVGDLATHFVLLIFSYHVCIYYIAKRFFCVCVELINK